MMNASAPASPATKRMVSRAANALVAAVSPIASVVIEVPSRKERRDPTVRASGAASSAPVR